MKKGVEMEISTALADHHRSFVPRSYTRPKSSREEVVGKESGDQWDVLKRLLGVLNEKFLNSDISAAALRAESINLASVILKIGLDFTDTDEAGFECNNGLNGLQNSLPTIKNLRAVACVTISELSGDRGQEVWNAFISGVKEYIEDMAEFEGKKAGGTTPG